jgi:hypothetical protein
MNTEIIPQLQFENPLDNALATNDTFSAKLLPLKQRAQDLKKQIEEMRARGVLYDAQTYGDFGAVLSEVRSIRKNEIVALWTPFFAVVDRVKDFLKLKRQAAENLCEEIDSLCRAEMKTLEIAESKATAKEQKVVDKTHPGATVKPNIPAVAGYRRSTTYPVTIVDEKALIRACLKAYKATDTKRFQFLAKFITANAKALADYARDLKNPDQFNKEVPGVKCRQE